MNDALERLRSRNRADVTLGSGVVVGIELSGMRDIFASGQLPISGIQKVLKDRPELADDPMKVAEAVSSNGDADWLGTQRAMVASIIRTIDGDAVKMKPADTSVFSDEEFYELLDYAMRTRPLPGKALAPSPSQRSRNRTRARSTGASVSTGASTPAPPSKQKTT